MQGKAYESDEVRKKLADLLVSLNRFYDPNVSTIGEMLNELELFLGKMEREYMPGLWEDVRKHMNPPPKGK